ncbi:MAG: efflux RND transporter periplasmic adaptor subunit [Armatimonadetes bacterium]|nr:efflux RND transporter periplasmic adaptor subunit [Armatimonadota bacterium]
MRRWLYVGLPLLLLVGLVAWRLVGRQAEVANLKKGAGPRSAVVQVTKVVPGIIENKIDGVGSLLSPNVVELSPKTSGRIDYLGVRVGDTVKAGQILVRIDPSEAKANLANAQANLAQARFHLAQAKLQQGANSATVTGQLDQNQATLYSAQADLNAAQSNATSLVAQAQAQLDDAISRAASADAQVNVAKANEAKERASLDNAKTLLDRTQSLFEEGFSSAQELDNARTAYTTQQRTVDVAAAQVAAALQGKESANAQVKAARNQLSVVTKTAASNLAAAKAKANQAQSGVTVARANLSQTPAYQENLAALASAVNAAQAQVDLAQAAVSQTQLSSPVDGTVTARNLDPGALATPNQPVIEVQSLDWLFFQTSFPIEFGPQIYVGMPVSITLDGVSVPLTGSVANANASADALSRRFTVLIRIPNADHGLRPGMFGKASVSLNRVAAEAVAPKEAVLTDADGKTTIAVVGADNKVQLRTVKLGATDGKSFQILDGVKPGETVVTLSYVKLRDGMDVRLPNAKGAGADGKASTDAAGKNGGQRGRRGTP